MNMSHRHDTKSSSCTHCVPVIVVLGSCSHAQGRKVVYKQYDQTVPAQNKFTCLAVRTVLYTTCLANRLHPAKRASPHIPLAENPGAERSVPIFPAVTGLHQSSLRRRPKGAKRFNPPPLPLVTSKIDARERIAKDSTTRTAHSVRRDLLFAHMNVSRC